MKVLSLFSGGGLGDYGLELAGFEVVGQCEIDDYCQKILRLRWPKIPKWKDIKDVTGNEIKKRCGSVDLISGGFPCQPFSVAGKQKGKEDDRHLWPEMFRIISEVKPTWVFGENVSGLIRLGLDEVLSDLEREGYTTQTFVIPACAVDAPHRRDRVWIVGYAKHARSHETEIRGGSKKRSGRDSKGAKQTGKPSRSSEQHEFMEDAQGERLEGGNYRREGVKTETKRLFPSRSGEQSENVANSVGDSKGSAHRGKCGKRKRGRKESNFSERNERDCGEALADPSKQRLQGSEQERGEESIGERISHSSGWPVEPDVGRVAHGIANRVDRLKLLGNGQVVPLVEKIGKMILEYETDNHRANEELLANH